MFVPSLLPRLVLLSCLAPSALLLGACSEMGIDEPHEGPANGPGQDPGGGDSSDPPDSQKPSKPGEEDEDTSLPPDEDEVEDDTSLPPACPRESSWDSSARSWELRVLQLVNEERKQGGSCGGESFTAAAALQMDPTLTCAARLHSQDMVDQGYFSHTSLDGRSPFDRMRDLGFEGFPSAENIAAGQSSPEAVVQTWMQSPGHCANILSSQSTHLGVGYVQGGSYGHMWTQTFGRK